MPAKGIAHKLTLLLRHESGEDGGSRRVSGKLKLK
jgi:hypothetical protein